MTELAIPSKVMDKKFIRMPEKNVVESDEEWDRCGKWILPHPCGDLGFVDAAWTSLQLLVTDGTLLMLKASTAKMANEGTVVLCFTRPGKREAKRAARAIRRVIDFNRIMYYKLNKQTSKGIDNRFGDKGVSLLMHTFRGVFYTRKHRSWIQDIEDGVQNIVPIASKFSKENYTGDEELPSTLKGDYFNSPENHHCEKTGLANWFIFCSCEDEGPYLSEANRVWLVAKQLLKDGLFEGLFVGIRESENVKYAEVRLYVSQHCDVYSRLTACDRIFEEASSRTVMYFTEAGKGKPTHQKGNSRPLHDFEYTSSGEFYRVTEYGHEYLFL